MNILVSACLLGIGCRYDGNSKETELIKKIDFKEHTLIPVCPEIYGGLSTPREASEISDGRVIDKKGKDVTEQFKKGANETLKFAKLFNASYAILKERSPSCGFGEIYDGTFSKMLISGNGITADLLSRNGVKVIGESEIDEILKIIK